MPTALTTNSTRRDRAGSRPQALAKVIRTLDAIGLDPKPSGHENYWANCPGCGSLGTLRAFREDEKTLLRCTSSPPCPIERVVTAINERATSGPTPNPDYAPRETTANAEPDEPAEPNGDAAPAETPEPAPVTSDFPSAVSEIAQGLKKSGPSTGFGPGPQAPVDTGDSGLLYVPPLPPNFGRDEPLFQRLMSYRAGILRPDPERAAPLRLDRLPRNASTLREVAKKVQLVMELQLTDDDARDVPLAASVVAWLMGLDPKRGKKTASYWLHQLESYEVIRSPGALDPTREDIDGTRTFQPFGYDLQAILDGERTVQLEVAA